MSEADISAAGLIRALQKEQAAIKPLMYTILSVQEHGDFFVFEVNAMNRGIDSQLENYKAKGNRIGQHYAWTGRVILVNGSTLTVKKESLRKRPLPREQIWLSPTDFLEIIIERIRERGLPIHYQNRMLRLQQLQLQPLEHFANLDKDLRKNQKRAVVSAGLPLSFIWGPPGTGKTFTLGAVVCALARAGVKVLALTTTNLAADQLAISIDDAFSRTRNHYSGPQQQDSINPGYLVRPGYAVSPSLETRHHLMLWSARMREFSEIIKMTQNDISNLNKKLNESTSAINGSILADIAQLREKIQVTKQERSQHLISLLNRASIIVTTVAHGMTVGGVYSAFENLNGPWALIIDEASMVSHFVLAKLMENNPNHLVIAGDIKQLSPIMMSNSKTLTARYWIEQSIFDAFGVVDDKNANDLERLNYLNMLNEQSRMHETLARVVSQAFYRGQLRTVDNPPAPPPWPQWPRESLCRIDPYNFPLPPEAPSHITRTPTDGGKRLERSAWIAIGLARLIVERDLKKTVHLITPFRLQCNLLTQPPCTESTGVKTIAT